MSTPNPPENRRATGHDPDAPTARQPTGPEHTRPLPAQPGPPAQPMPPASSAQPARPAGDAEVLDRREVVAREKEQFGGMKFGAAFFGWLAASGMAVLLTALVAGAGAAFGLGRNMDPNDPTGGDVATVGLIGAIILLVIIFISYFSGGYVAGRMARFNGIKQGLGVWLWALIVAIVIAILGTLAGAQFDVLARLNGFPRIPLNEGALTTAGVITAVGVAVVSLIGALLGGLAGMRFHRRVDKAGLGR